jgi:hypothetical protein
MYRIAALDENGKLAMFLNNTRLCVFEVGDRKSKFDLAEKIINFLNHGAPVDPGSVTAQVIDILKQCHTEEGAYCMIHRGMPSLLVDRIRAINYLLSTAVDTLTKKSDSEPTPGNSEWEHENLVKEGFALRDALINAKNTGKDEYKDCHLDAETVDSLILALMQAEEKLTQNASLQARLEAAEKEAMENRVALISLRTELLEGLRERGLPVLSRDSESKSVNLIASYGQAMNTLENRIAELEAEVRSAYKSDMTDDKED